MFDWNLYWRYEKQTNLFSISVCPVGSFLNPDNSGTCEICPVDTYSSGTNANSCIACASGRTTQGQTGLSSAEACGKYIVDLCTCLWWHCIVAVTSISTEILAFLRRQISPGKLFSWAFHKSNLQWDGIAVVEYYLSDSVSYYFDCSVSFWFVS